MVDFPRQDVVCGPWVMQNVCTMIGRAKVYHSASAGVRLQQRHATGHARRRSGRWQASAI